MRQRVIYSYLIVNTSIITAFSEFNFQKRIMKLYINQEFSVLKNILTLSWNLRPVCPICLSYSSTGVQFSLLVFNSNIVYIYSL